MLVDDSRDENGLQRFTHFNPEQLISRQDDVAKILQEHDYYPFREVRKHVHVYIYLRNQTDTNYVLVFDRVIFAVHMNLSAFIKFQDIKCSYTTICFTELRSRRKNGKIL